MTSIAPVKDHVGTIAQWLAIGTVVVTALFRFAALEQAKDIAVSNHAVQEIRLDKLEERVRALETSRTIEIQITALTAEVAALKVQVSAMREDLKGKRR